MSAQPPVKLYSGMGALHHPIATKNPEAQKFFDQGLTLVYAFNHEEAIRSFEHASELDPAAAMPYWGKALAIGPNYNMDVDPEREIAAFNAIHKAKELAAGGPENERAYVDALITRYNNDLKPDLSKLAQAYAAAMRDLAHRYPDDPDAQVLYAESLMDLHPWQLWSVDGKPNENTDEIISVLEGVLRRWPNHIGANHYYIHALEASPHPERAQASAKRLETSVPAAGHLVHMPAHIYARTGDFPAAVKSNQDAVKVDNAFIKESGATQTMYAMMYLGHNLDFLAYAAGMNGQFKIAQGAAHELEENEPADVSQTPMVQGFPPTPLLVLLRFGHWDDVLALKAPDAKLVAPLTFWHFGRTCAFAMKGQLVKAEEERKAFTDTSAHLNPGPAYGMYYNEWSVLLGIAGHVMDARIAAAKGYAANGIPASNAGLPEAISHWRQAVEIQDKMAYDEPPEWYYPVRESLGAALLIAGKPAEAELTFREDLKRNPRNPRSLFGLWKSLEAQKKSTEAQQARQMFEAAWKSADVQLRLEDF